MVQLIIGFMFIVLGAIVSMVEKLKSRRNPGYRRNNIIAATLFFIGVGGGLLSLLSGIDAVTSSQRNMEISEHRQRSIDSQSTVIYKLDSVNQSLLKTQLEYSVRLDSSTWKNFELSNQLVRQATRMSDYMSGKGSYCYFLLGARNPGTNSYQLVLYSAGENPMDNVIARIVNVYEMVATPPTGLGTTLSVGKVYPRKGYVQLFQSTFTPYKRDSIWMNVFFQTEGRDFIEELQEVRVKDKWTVALAVTEGGKDLLRRVDKDFPGWLKIK
jgi:hypothetical protein